MAVFTVDEDVAAAAALLRNLAAVIAPPPQQLISEWADGRIVIPGETGAVRTGPLSWVGFEYLIEPLDTLHPDDPGRDTTFMGSAQIAKTTIGILATLYYSDVTPRSWGVALPSLDEVRKYNRTKWQPIVDATPFLKRKIKPVTSRDEQGSTADFKRFAGGTGLLFATGSPKALQMVTFCLAVYEETPNWEREVGDRGDPRSQIRKRQLQWELAGAKTFHNSTPGLVRRDDTAADGKHGELRGCPVTEDFLAGDQRRLYHPCPHCGDAPGGVHLRLDRAQMLGLGEGQTPHFNCPGCGAEITHRHKSEMVRRSVWLPTFLSTDPGNSAPPWAIPSSEVAAWRARPTEGRAYSYHAWQVVSPAVDWAYIAAEVRKADKAGQAEQIALHQQIFGEAYELVMAKTDIQQMLDRRDARMVRGVVPSGAELLTGTIDFNGDWAQWSVYAWGPNSEHWLVDRGRIEGSPSDVRLWTDIRELVYRSFPHEDGGALPVEVWGLDSGFGTFHVYAFCRLHPHCLALDGADGWGRVPLRRGLVQKLRGDDGVVVACRTWRVGTWDLKRSLLNDAIPRGLDGDKGARGPGKAHWPGWVDRDFFEELTAEALVEVQDKKTGVMKSEAWVRVRRRNEEMDLAVYATALARSRGVGVPGSEPDWIELARRRQAATLGLEALWQRPTPPPASAVRMLDLEDGEALPVDLPVHPAAPAAPPEAPFAAVIARDRLRSAGAFARRTRL